jgi:hypothetical protein
MDIQQIISPIKQFRQALYQTFTARADATMDLLDALSSNTAARSVVDLSLNPLFRRGYSSVHDALDEYFQASEPGQARRERQALEQAQVRLIVRRLPKPTERKFWLLAQDATPYPRAYAPTLTDRGYVYQPNILQGNKPVTLGHQYSVLAVLPEKSGPSAPPWVVPLTLQRISISQTEVQVGVEAVRRLLTDPTLPFCTDLTVDVVDAKYSVVPFLGKLTDHANLVIIARSAGNRVYYRSVAGSDRSGGSGHPIWYGERFALRELETWGRPDTVLQTTHISLRRHTYTVVIEAWNGLLMRGKRDVPMHDHPFSLVRIRLLDAKGQSVFKRAMWLIVMGQRRHELSLLDIWHAYRQRYDLEHFFRFGKQRLLLDKYQTPDTEHEENWVQVVKLAYVQSWLFSPLTYQLPRPWEKYLPASPTGVASPSQTQRDAERITRQIGTPAAPPKRRGNSPGRRRGTKLPRRQWLPVVKKTKTSQKTSRRT